MEPPFLIYLEVHLFCFFPWYVVCTLKEPAWLASICSFKGKFVASLKIRQWYQSEQSGRQARLVASKDFKWPNSIPNSLGISPCLWSCSPFLVLFSSLEHNSSLSLPFWFKTLPVFALQFFWDRGKSFLLPRLWLPVLGRPFHPTDNSKSSPSVIKNVLTRRCFPTKSNEPSKHNGRNEMADVQHGLGYGWRFRKISNDTQRGMALVFGMNNCAAPPSRAVIECPNMQMNSNDGY